MVYINILRSLKQGWQGAPLQEGLVLPQANIGLQTVTEVGQLLMQLCACLGDDYIPLPLVFSMLGHNDVARLNSAVAGLLALSMMRVDQSKAYTDKHAVGLRVHRQVQLLCKSYDGWAAGVGYKTVAEKLAFLCEVRTALMPRVEEMPDKRWKAAELYSPHVV